MPRDPDRPRPWSLATLIGFRFALIYLVLYGVPGIMSELPIVSWLSEKFLALWSPLVRLTGDLLFGLDVPDRLPNGSGDQLASYVEIACLLVIAGIGTIVWSLVDRRRPDYDELARWLRVYLRYLLAFTMILYGMVKVVKSQFPEPSPGRLLVPIGQTSPMGLLWTFMGHSTAYTVFGGLAEITGGALLLFRRTTALGALMLVAVLGHVVILNYSYDVPVKIFSTHLLLLALILLAPDARRLLDLLVLNRPAQPADLSGPTVPPRWRRPLVAGKAVVVTGMVIYIGWVAFDGYRTFGDGAERIPPHGAYRVVEMARDGVASPPGDPTAWRHIGISRGAVVVVASDGSVARFGAMYHPASRRIDLADRDDRSRTGGFTATLAGSELHLEGALDGQPISLRAQRMEESEFLLRRRGFHWVSDEPFNR